MGLAKAGTVFKRNSIYGLIDTNGREILHSNSQIFTPVREGITVAKPTGIQAASFQFYNTAGENIGEPIYTKVSMFSDGRALVCSMVTGRGPFGFIDRWGREVIKQQYADARPFEQGMALVSRKSDNLWGAIDTNGHTVIPFKFSSIGDFEDNIAIARIDHRTRLIDRRGNFVHKASFSRISDLRSGLAAVHFFSDRVGGLSIEDGFLFACPGDDIKIIGENVLYFMVDDQRYFTRDGSEILPQQFQRIKWIGDGLFGAWSDGAWIIVDEEGKPQNPHRYDAVWPFTKGIAPVRRGKWTFVNSRAEELLSPRFDFACVLDSGYAAAGYQGCSKLLDEKGEVLRTFCDTIVVSHFTNGIAKLEYNKYSGLMDRQGNIVRPLEYGRGRHATHPYTIDGRKLEFSIYDRHSRGGLTTLLRRGFHEIVDEHYRLVARSDSSRAYKVLATGLIAEYELDKLRPKPKKETKTKPLWPLPES